MHCFFRISERFGKSDGFPGCGSEGCSQADEEDGASPLSASQTDLAGELRIHQQEVPTALCQEYRKGKEKDQQRERGASTPGLEPGCTTQVGPRSLQPWPSSSRSSEDSEASSPSWGCPWKHSIPAGPGLIPSLLALDSSHARGPSGGQLASCSRIRSGAAPAVLIRYRPRSETRWIPWKGCRKDTPSCCPCLRLDPAALIPALIPLHNGHSVGAQAAPSSPADPVSWPRPRPEGVPREGVTAGGAAGTGGPASCGVSISR